MNAAPTSPRDVKPADRPPPRDPQAAGGSDGEADTQPAGFADLVKKATEPNAPAATTEKPDGTALSQGDGLEVKGPEEKDKPDDASAIPAVAQPVLAQPAKPLPPTLTEMADHTGAPSAQDSAKNAARPSLSKESLSGPAETKSTQQKMDGPARVETFDALLNAPHSHADLPPVPPSTQALTTEPRAPAPAALPAPAAPQPTLPVAALPAAIGIKALSGSNRFDIRLDPEELGRIDVALEIDQDGAIRASITADKPEALQLIVREARALEQAFDQAGFRRDENALNFSLSDRQSASQDQPGSHRQQTTRFFVDGETELPPALAHHLTVTTSRADGRLDVRI